jgi:hypothetical protein
LEHYTHEWTIFVVKRRKTLDKTDRRDHAQSLFTLDRNGLHRTDGRTLWDLRQPHAANATANAIAAADAALIVAQQTAIDALVADANSIVLETDRTVLTSFCDLSQQEFMVYDESVRVFDEARSHFVFDIVDEQVKRFLNAERLTNLARANPTVLKWKDYKELILNRLPDATSSFE